LSPCRAAVALFFAPLAVAILVGVMVSDHVLAALERAQRERQREAEKRLTRDNPPDTPPVTTVASSDGGMEMRDFRWDAEVQWFIRDTAVHGPVIEWLYDGGATANVRN